MTVKIALKRILALLLLILTSYTYAEDQSFLIVIHASNHKSWVKKNLDSLFNQSYNQFQVVYIDDASSDGTPECVEDYILKHSLQERLVLIKNEQPKGQLACLFEAVQDCPSDTIILPLKGCDWLAHRNALSDIHNTYTDSSIWLTYGQYSVYPHYSCGNAHLISQESIENNEHRSKLSYFPSLKTFYAGLFHQIRSEDLLAFPPSASDHAFFIPLLEMAGRHSKYIPEIHYVYNSSQKEPFPIQILNAEKKYQPLVHYNDQTPLKKIYITPGFWGELFAIDNPIFNRDNCLEVLYRLRETAREAGYEIYQADHLERIEDFEYLIVFDVFEDQLQLLSRFPKEKKILFLWEPPSVIPANYILENHRDFAKVITWHDGFVDNEKYFKFFYPVIHPAITSSPSFDSKKLCTLIACNKNSSFPGELYSERRNLIQFYENIPNDDFTLYGKWWPESLTTYGGPIDKKVDVLKHFRFCYAYENICGIPGYITEKIFDCFQAGTIPVYWGAPNISSYIPNNCYILREDFQSDAALYSHLKNMSEDRYQEYLDNIRHFLKSDQARLYSQDHFISLFMQLISTPSEGIAKLLCPEKSMILRPLAHGNQTATITSTRPTPMVEEKGCKWPQKDDFIRQMSFAIPSST